MSTKIAAFPLVWVQFATLVIAQASLSAQASVTTLRSSGNSAPRNLPAASVASSEPDYVVSIRTDCGAHLLLTDGEGNQCTFTTDAESSCAQIPAVSYGDNSISDPEDESIGFEERELVLSRPARGSYLLKVLPTGRESYGIEFHCQGVGDDRFHRIVGETLPINEHHRYRVLAEPECPADFARGALSSKVHVGDAPQLSYAFPDSFNVQMKLGKPFHLVVVYGPQLKPAEFGAKLNGVSVAALFHPNPSTIESVEIPLRPGRNQLQITTEAGDHADLQDNFAIDVLIEGDATSEDAVHRLTSTGAEEPAHP